MDNNAFLKIIDSYILKFEEENRSLKSKIKDVHVNNACLEEDFKNMTSTFCFKVWQVIRSARNFIPHKS